MDAVSINEDLQPYYDDDDIGKTYDDSDDLMSVDDGINYVDNEEAILDEAFESIFVGAVDLDKVMVAHATKPKDVNVEQLAKVWKISLEDATSAIISIWILSLPLPNLETHHMAIDVVNCL